MEEYCGCHHEHCHKIKKAPKLKTYPFTMENLIKGVKNINAIIDMVDTRQDEKREQMIIFLKAFCDDLVERFKNKKKPEKEEVKTDEEKKEPDIPIIERINKTIFHLLQLKPSVMKKYGSEFFEKVWELNDEENNYTIPEDILSQPHDKKLTLLEIMKYFLQLLFGGEKKIEDILRNGYIIIEQEKRKIYINEDKIKEMTENEDKYMNENNLLVNLMLIKISTYTRHDIFSTSVTGLLMYLENRIIKLYKMLSLYAITLWNIDNKKEELIKSILSLYGGVLRDFEKIKYFQETKKDEHYFPAITLPEKTMVLIKKLLLLTTINFITISICGNEVNKSYNMQDGYYWDDNQAIILKLKDPKISDEQRKDMLTMIPTSVDMKSIIILFLSDFFFFFCSFFTYVKDNKLVSDFDHFENLKKFSEDMIIYNNCNIVTFFEKNLEHQRSGQIIKENMEYEIKDNFNTLGLFYILFLIIHDKRMPLIINKSTYITLLTNYFKCVLRDAKDFAIENKSKDILKYYFEEMKKMGMTYLNDEDFNLYN